MTWGHFILVLLNGISLGVVASTPSLTIATIALCIAIILIVTLYFWMVDCERHPTPVAGQREVKS